MNIYLSGSSRKFLEELFELNTTKVTKLPVSKHCLYFPYNKYHIPNFKRKLLEKTAPLNKV